jgi:HEPN domain-containing protein
MNEVVKEWMTKAEGDFQTAGREFQAEPPNYDAVCFHAQQCIEKYMKALLIESRQVPPKVHDLVVLAAMIKQVRPTWDWPVEALRLLSRAAVIYRYPGESAEREEAEAVLAVCRSLRESLRSELGVG